MAEIGDAMSQMRRLSFADIEMPYQKIELEGGGDDHEHKYPHTAGSANEKLGRKLYRVTVHTRFDENFIGDHWEKLYPYSLQLLTFHFERQDTATLVLPNVGEIQAYCTNWTRTLEAKVRSGEDVVLKFKEDLNAELVADQGIAIERRSLRDQAATLQWQSRNLDNRNIFDKITDQVNEVLGVLDRGELYGNLVAAKIEGLTRLLRTADEIIDELNDPVNHAVLDALHRLWDSVLDIAEDLTDTGRTLNTYRTLQDGTITDAALAIYQDASRASDLLGLNVILDPLLIPAGTAINFYPDE